MSNELTVGIIGLYTFVYIIVFFIQKSQIDKQKEITSSMKSFIDIFDVKKVKEYAETIQETNLMKLDKIISDNKTVNEIMRKVTNEKIDELKKLYNKEMGNQHIEMTLVICYFLKHIDKEERVEFINNHLESCNHIFIPMLADIDDDICSNEP